MSTGRKNRPSTIVSYHCRGRAPASRIEARGRTRGSKSDLNDLIERLAVSMLALSLDWDAVSSTMLACAVRRSDSSFSTRAIRLETTTAAVSAVATDAAIAIIVPGAFPGAPMKLDISLPPFLPPPTRPPVRTSGFHASRCLTMPDHWLRARKIRFWSLPVLKAHGCVTFLLRGVVRCFARDRLEV